jgi:hypothetical protein
MVGFANRHGRRREASVMRQGFRAIVQPGDTTHRAGYIAVQLALLVLMVIAASSASCLTSKLPTAADFPTCRYSEAIHDADASLLRQKAPTRFKLMPSRYMLIVQAARGYHCSGAVTVAFNGHNYLQAGMNDDAGIVELIPLLASSTGMSLADTFDLTEFMVISSGILIGYAGFWRLYPDRWARWVGVVVFLCLGLAEATVADVYIFQTSPLIAGTPWILHFALTSKTCALNVSAALLAFCCSWCSWVRSGTTLICLAFLITLFICRYRIQKIFLPLLLILLGCVAPVLFMRHLLARRDNLLATLGDTTTTTNSHLLWHTIYIGLGFVPNSVVPEYKDAVAVDRVRSIDPRVPFGSKEYEIILKHEVWNLAKRRPMLLLENLAAKVGVLMFSAWILLFPARRALFAERKVLWLDAAFVLATGMSAMNVVVAVPRPRYLLTFLCLTLLYSSVKVCRAHLLATGNKTPVVQQQQGMV